MIDDTTLNTFVKTIDNTPEEAAKNITNSKFYEVNPDVYNSHKESFDKEIDTINRIPTSMEDSSKEFITTSKQHAAAAKDDYSNLNFIERRVKYYKSRIIDLPKFTRESNDYWNRIADGEKLPDEEKEYLDDLDFQISEIQSKSYGIDNEGEKFVVDTLGGVGNILQSYYDNKAILGGSIAAGAGTGGLVALGIPIPGARVVGVGAGAISGYHVGSALVGFIDGYYQTRASTYKELEFAVDDKGKSLNIDDSTKRLTATGVGFIGGTLYGLSSLVLARNNPLVNKFISSKLVANELLKSPALLAKTKIIGSIANSIYAQGGAGALQELSKIVGVEFGKMDATKASFENVLDKIISMKTAKQVGHSAALAGATGGLFTATMGAVGYKGLKNRYNQAQEIASKRQDINLSKENYTVYQQQEATLTKQNHILEVSAATQKAKLSNLLPEETNGFIKSIYDKLPVNEEIYYTLEDLRDFSSDPKKGEAVRNLIDKTGQLNKLAPELNTHIKFQENEILDIVKQYPDFTDYLKLEVDGKTPKEIRNESQIQVERLQKAHLKRQEIESNFPTKPLTPEQEIEINDILNPPEPEQKVPKDKYDYLDFERFEPIEGIISQKEVDILNNIELDAKLDVAKQLELEVEQEYQKSEDRIVRDITRKQINEEFKQLEKNFLIVDTYKQTKDTSEAARAVISKHEKPGFSPLAIEPDSLDPTLKKLYLDVPELNKKLKRRKAFVKGGIHIDEAVALTGVDSPEQLLKVLLETPNKVDVKKISEQRKIAVRNKIQQTILPSKITARDKAFTDVTKTRLKQMDYIVSKEWPTIKRGTIKIAGRPPKVEALNRKAKSIISKLPLKDINPKVFENGEINSRKKAMKSWVNTEFEQAYKHLESSALNNELRKEALNAKDRIKKYEKFWRKTVNTKSNQETLRKSGMLKVMEEFTDVYKMSTSSTGLKELKSFNDFLTRQVLEGKFVPEIPKRLDDVRMSARDMSMEQFQSISEMGQFILHQAKLKNKLLTLQQDRSDFITADKIAKGIEDNTVNHPLYDPKKAKEIPFDYINVSEDLHYAIRTGLTLNNTIKTSIAELDNFKLGGYFQETFGDRIKQTRDLKRFEIRDIEANDKKIINKYGMDKFKKLFNTFIFIPEFEGRPDLGDGEGKIRKIDLLTMQAYRGDKDGRIGLENFVDGDLNKLSIDVIDEVLNRELTHEDASLVQSLLVDRFNRFRDRTSELNKRTTGIEMTLVEGVPVNHNDVELPGGYYPIKRKPVPDDVKAAKYLDKVKQQFGEMSGKEDSHFFAKLRSAEMTDQGRSKERTGSDRPIDIKFENVFDFTEEFVHDLHFRELGIDLLKVLKNSENVTHMKSVLGERKYVNFLNSVKDMISKTTESESSLFSEEYGKMNKFIDDVHSLHAVKAIGLNLTSMMIQPDSLLNLNLRVGPKSSLYLMKAAKKLAANPMMFDKYIEIAGEINPDIILEKDGIDNKIVKQSYDWIPVRTKFFKNYENQTAQAAASIKGLQKKMVDVSFSLVREGDKMNKVLATMALSEQFLNGDIEGFPLEVINKMSDKEKAAKMSSVVREAIDLSLTANAPEDRTALEKNEAFKTMVRYFVDRRSRLNSMVAQLQKTKTNIKEGDYRKAVKNMLTLALTSGVSLAFMNTVRKGVGETWDEIKKAFKDEDSALEFAQDTAWYFALAPLQQFADMTPIIDNINYSANLDIKSDYRNVSSPFFGVMTDVATGANALNDALKAARKLNKPNLSSTQWKAIIADLGYISGGFPTNAVIKLSKFAESKEIKKSGKFFKDSYKELDKQINLFIDEFKDKPEAKKFIEDLKEYQEQNIPKQERDIQSIIPEDSLEVLKTNKWDDYDPDTKGAGVYQFTEDRWNEISEIAPNLGLTENGRVSKNTSEQEKAMRWELEQNAKALTAYQIPVDNTSLYGAHRFGLDDYVMIALSKNDKKLKNIVSDMTLFKGFTTVKQVKAYINKQIRGS